MEHNIWRRINEEIAVWRVGALPGMAILGLVIIARLFGLLQSLEWSTFDTLLRLRLAEPVDERILIIGINEADIRRIGAYPIPDQELAILLRRLQTYNPRAIGLDLFRDLPTEPGYVELVATFKASKNLIAIEKVLPDRVSPPLVLPPEQIGFSDTIVDADGKVRRNLLGTPTAEGYKFSLALRLAEKYLSAQGITLENGIRDHHAMRFGATELPRFFPNSGGYVRADAGGVQVLLNFRSSRERFRTLSLTDIKIGNFDPSWIRDRIVLIGINSPGVDQKNTSAIATANSGLIYGVEYHAHAISQIISAVLDQRPLIKTWADGWEYVWIISWGILGISLSRLTQSPWKNLLSVGLACIGLAVCSIILLGWGWWVPVAPALLVLALNGVGLTAFYQYDQALRSRINERQFVIEHTFDTIHNGPLQTLAKLLRAVREQDLPSEQLLSELEQLNRELRAVYESVQRETLNQEENLHLGSGLELNLQAPLHEILYEVYSTTLERNFPCFKTLKVKVRTFEPIDAHNLTIEQKRGLCRFLEEALCNVGKHAKEVTRLNVMCIQKDGWCIVRITDNGVGIQSRSEGRGTQQCKTLARQLGGTFQRIPLSPKGTLCELTWPVAKPWFGKILLKFVSNKLCSFQ